jgi:hypothetical protein
VLNSLRAGSAYIQAGWPWQNPYAESFGARIRDELLAVERFFSLAEAQVPPSALRMMNPARFAASIPQPPLGLETDDGWGTDQEPPAAPTHGVNPTAAALPNHDHDRVRLRRSPQ